MTREEASVIIGNLRVFGGDECYSIAEYQEAKAVAIQALLQEPILDKIRAEIEKEYLAEGHLSDYWDGIDKCLQILDKYKAESGE